VSRIEKTHAQRDIIVAQPFRDERCTFFLPRCESLPPQFPEQKIQHFWIDVRFVTEYDCRGN
jgi:hypothetical protein